MVLTVFHELFKRVTEKNSQNKHEVNKKTRRFVLKDSVNEIRMYNLLNRNLKLSTYARNLNGLKDNIRELSSKNQ